jgi:carbamoyl-phosphate synthase/aspartate carbamoyltransferase/dihydroorotase
VIKIPGMVDPHVHLRGMDWSHKGTFASETAAAVAGGYWAVLDMPNTQPSTIDRPALERKLAEFSSEAVCDWGLYFGAAMSENWRCYDDVIGDVCGLKIYNNATTGTLLIDDQSVREQHYRAWPGHKMIAVHAEGETVLDILALVRAYRKKTHFCHISTAEEIRYLTEAKNEGLPVTIGVCPHHLYLTRDDVPRLGALGLMKPELKTKADQRALWEALESGVVDVVESDHAPHTLEEKFSDKPVYGVPGLETTLPLLCLAVREGRLSMERVIDLVATNPRRIFGLDCPAETYTLVDVDESFIIERENLYTLCGWSPFEGMRVYGRVRAVCIRGHQVYDGEKILSSEGFGQNLYSPPGV